MCDNSCCFEPTVTLNGIPISSNGCQAPTRKRIAEEGKSSDCGHPPSLRLGVKRQEPAFWANRRKSSLI